MGFFEGNFCPICRSGGRDERVVGVLGFTRGKLGVSAAAFLMFVSRARNPLILWRHLIFDQALYKEAKRRFIHEYEMLCTAAGSVERIGDFLDRKAKESARSEHDGPMS